VEQLQLLSICETGVMVTYGGGEAGQEANSFLKFLHTVYTSARITEIKTASQKWLQSQFKTPPVKIYQSWTWFRYDL